MAMLELWDGGDRLWDLGFAPPPVAPAHLWGGSAPQHSPYRTTHGVCCASLLQELHESHPGRPQHAWPPGEVQKETFGAPWPWGWSRGLGEGGVFCVESTSPITVQSILLSPSPPLDPECPRWCGPGEAQKWAELSSRCGLSPPCVPQMWIHAVLPAGAQKGPGSGGIRTHAPGETGALIQRLRPLGHATPVGKFGLHL